MGFFALLTKAFGVRFQSSLRTDDQVFGDDYFRVEEQVALGTAAMLATSKLNGPKRERSSSAVPACVSDGVKTDGTCRFENY